MNSKLIAACGMNCQLCQAFLRDKNTCPGCRFIDQENAGESYRKYCAKCLIRNCLVIRENNWRFCSPKYEKFPCQRLKNLDKRYKTRYAMSMIENLEFIHDQGIRKFIKSQKKKYIKGDKIFCIHNKKTYDIKNH